MPKILGRPAGSDRKIVDQAAVQRNGVPSRHIRCMITASLRATATLAFFSELRAARRVPRLPRGPLAEIYRSKVTNSSGLTVRA